MCGIVGYIGTKKAVPVLIKGLLSLEYRGYDSAGICVLDNDKLDVVKDKGRVKNLEDNPELSKLLGNIGIAHTRWATHGIPSKENAHPHLDSTSKFAVVHNGIIENYTELKDFLTSKGYKLKSETDTEVIPNLISYYYDIEKDVLKAVNLAIKSLKGSYAIEVITPYLKDSIIVARKDSPLVIGIGEIENFIASDIPAVLNYTSKFYFLEDKELATVKKDKITFYNYDLEEISKDIKDIEWDCASSEKGKFEDYMLKEIYEQPDVLKRTISEYIDINKNEIIFPNFKFDLSKINFLTIVACGTSYHAGCVAKYFIEDMTGIFVNVDIASEFRYRSNPITDNGLAIFISQSGETADTIAALNYCKKKKQNILSIVNVTQSTIANLSDVILKTMAGTEIGVASTKAFTAQVSLLYLLAIEIAKKKNKITIDKYHELIENFVKSKNILKESLQTDKINEIKRVSQKLSKTKNIICIGRNILYPIALECALKIKEVSYIPTNGIASGELKHGTIALVDNKTFVIALNNSQLLYEKNLSSIEEILARKGKVIVIGDRIEKKQHLFSFIKTPETFNNFEILLSMIIPIQLLAYYISTMCEIDVDKPRNLAKSVTVE